MFLDDVCVPFFCGSGRGCRSLYVRFFPVFLYYDGLPFLNSVTGLRIQFIEFFKAQTETFADAVGRFLLFDRVYVPSMSGILGAFNPSSIFYLGCRKKKLLINLKAVFG